MSDDENRSAEPFEPAISIPRKGRGRPLGGKSPKPPGTRTTEANNRLKDAGGCRMELRLNPERTRKLDALRKSEAETRQEILFRLIDELDG